MNLKKEHIEYFKKEFLRYAKLYKVVDINFVFETVKKHDRFCNAFIDNEVNNGMATVTLITDNFRLDGRNIKEALRESAKHELIHTIISRFEEIAYSRFTNRQEIYDELEVLVRKLTKILPDK